MALSYHQPWVFLKLIGDMHLENIHGDSSTCKNICFLKESFVRFLHIEQAFCLICLKWINSQNLASTKTVISWSWQSALLLSLRLRKLEKATHYQQEQFIALWKPTRTLVFRIILSRNKLTEKLKHAVFHKDSVHFESFCFLRCSVVPSHACNFYSKSLLTKRANLEMGSLWHLLAQRKRFCFLRWMFLNEIQFFDQNIII